MTSALAVCKTCGMPIRVVFDEDGNVTEVFSVCGHVKKEDSDDKRV